MGKIDKTAYCNKCGTELKFFEPYIDSYDTTTGSPKWATIKHCPRENARSLPGKARRRSVDKEHYFLFFTGFSTKEKAFLYTMDENNIGIE